MTVGTFDRALVVGGTGFIGGQLLARLSKTDVSLDCLAFADRGQPARLAPPLSIRTADADDVGSIRQALGGRPYDVVFNLAGQGVSGSDRSPSTLLDGNAGFVARLLEALSASPPRLVINAGSWSEYRSLPHDQPLTEESSLASSSLYGAAKAAATTYGCALSRQLGLGFVTLRLFNVYGTGEAPHRLIPYVISRLVRSEPADLTPGDQERDFVHIDDAVDAFVVAATSTSLETYSAYNVCTGISTTVRSLAEEIARQLDKPRDLLRFGARQHRSDEPLTVVGDPTRFEDATGWKSTVTTAAGIATMAADAMEGALE